MLMRKTKRPHIQSRKKRSFVEEFIALPDEDKDRIAAEFNREFSINDTKPLTARERRQWERIVRKDRAAQKRARSAKVRVSLALDGDLVHRMDTYAEAHGLSRSELFTRGAEAILARAG
jgi:hypothetical protein